MSNLRALAIRKASTLPKGDSTRSQLIELAHKHAYVDDPYSVEEYFSLISEIEDVTREVQNALWERLAKSSLGGSVKKELSREMHSFNSPSRLKVVVKILQEGIRHRADWATPLTPLVELLDELVDWGMQQASFNKRMPLPEDVRKKRIQELEEELKKFSGMLRSRVR